jgi:hypothetical protein
MPLGVVSAHHVGIPEELEPCTSERAVPAGTLPQTGDGHPVLGGTGLGGLLPAQLERKVLRSKRQDYEALKGSREAGALATKFERWRCRARFIDDGPSQIGNLDWTHACSFDAPSAGWFAVHIVLDRADEA